jgi:hypothetical protein
VLEYAREVDPKALHEAARQDLALTALTERPSEYRGVPVYLEGRLKMLTPFDTDPILRDEGIKTVYEGWIFLENSPNKRACVIFTELPPNFQTSQKNDFRVDCKVECDAYFFKDYRYPIDDNGKKKYTYAPLFLGRSFTVTDPNPTPATTGWSQIWISLAIGAGVLVVILVVLIIGLNWWFRRGDRTTQYRLAIARNALFDGAMDGEPAPEPPARKPETPPLPPPTGAPTQQN